MADAHEKRGIGASFSAIDKQVPSLTYFGFAFWMAWNSIAFSGSFWLHDTESSIRTENLIIVHLVASAVTLVAFAVFSKYTTRIVSRNWFTLIGACVAFLGSLFIVITRESIFPSQTLFTIGAVLSGAGTTVLFLRAVPLFGALRPRRSITLFAGCLIVASVIYLVLNNCSNEVATVCFLLLPFCSFALYALRRKGRTLEVKVLRSQEGLSRSSSLFLLSVLLCSAAFEIARSLSLISIPPTYAIESMTISQLLLIVILGVVIFAVLLTRGAYRYGTVYSVAAVLLVVSLLITAVIPSSTTIIPAIAQTICTCFNMTVWAMLAYIVFQAESSAIKIFAWGNAALSLGTVIGGYLVQVDYELSIFDGDQMRIMLVILGIIVLIDLVFAFSERQISKLVKPIDPERLEEATDEDKHPRQWVLTCEAIAKEYGLSERESQVFVMLARGRSPQEIAEHEVLSIYTIRAHIRSIYAKLDVHSRNELVKLVEDHEKEG